MPDGIAGMGSAGLASGRYTGSGPERSENYVIAFVLLVISVAPASLADHPPPAAPVVETAPASAATELPAEALLSAEPEPPGSVIEGEAEAPLGDGPPAKARHLVAHGPDDDGHPPPQQPPKCGLELGSSAAGWGLVVGLLVLGRRQT